MEGLKSVLIFAVGFTVAWIILRFMAIRWRDAEKAKTKAAKEKEGAMQKLKTELEKRETITNDEVQKLLGVSDATATRYLDELEKEGVLCQVGKTGHSVYYEKIK